MQRDFLCSVKALKQPQCRQTELSRRLAGNNSYKPLRHTKAPLPLPIRELKLDVIIDGVSKSYNLYNLQGIDVTKLNGSLISGVYIVVINDKYIGKIFVK